MTVNEEIVTGRKFRKLIDEATKLWQRISFWTKASDVEFDDGQTAETKVGAIDGITDSLVSTSSRIAASAKALAALNKKLAQGRIEIVVNDDNSLGYRLDGADTVTPFSNSLKKRNIYSIGAYADSTSTYIRGNITIPSDCKEGYLIIDAKSIYQNYVNNVQTNAYFTSYAISGGIISHKVINQPSAGNLYNTLIKCKFQPGATITITLYTNTTVHHYWVYSIPINILY